MALALRHREETQHQRQCQAESRQVPGPRAGQAMSGREVWSSASRYFQPSSLLRQLSHNSDQFGLALKPDARNLWHGNVAVFHLHAIRKSAEGLKEIGIILIAAKSKACGNIQRHLMPAVRDATARRPAGSLHNFQRPQVLAKPIRQCAIELQPIAVRPHSAVAKQVARILVAEEVFTYGHWAIVVISQSCLGSEE